MSSSYHSEMNNLSQRIENKIQRMLDQGGNYDITTPDRDPQQRRNGGSNFGARQLSNIVDQKFATFGTGTNTQVGP